MILLEDLLEHVLEIIGNTFLGTVYRAESSSDNTMLESTRSVESSTQPFQLSVTDFEYLSGGPDSDGSFTHTLSPGDTRFVTGGKEGSLDLSTQTVVVDITVSLSFWVEILLLLAILGLGASAFDMNFPILSNIFSREE